MFDQNLKSLVSEEDLVSFCLENGCFTHFKPVRGSGLVSVRVYVKTGSLDEDFLAGTGVSHFLEHLCFKGGERRSGEAMVAEISSMGGDLNAFTSHELTCYHALVPSEGFVRTVELLRDLVFHAGLEEDDFLVEQEVILREMAMVEDNPDWKLLDGVWNTVFRLHPGKHPVIGYQSLFRGLGLSDVKDYYDERYGASNTILSVAGDVSEELLRSTVQQSFGELPRKLLRPSLLPREPEQLARRELRLEGDVSVVRGALVYPFDGRDRVTLAAARILADWLAGGASSVLVRKLRKERSVVSSIEASAFRIGEEGIFMIFYVCQPGRDGLVEEAVLDTINQALNAGVPSSAIEHVRHKVIAREISRRQTVDGLASSYGQSAAALGDPLARLADLQQVVGMDADRVTGIAKNLFTPERLTVGTLSPEGKRFEGLGGGVLKPRSQKDIELKELPGGACLIMEPNRRLPLFSLVAAFEGGEGLLQGGCPELCDLFCSLWTQDTNEQTAEEVAETVDGLGAGFFANHGFTFHALRMNGLSGDWKGLTEVFGNALTSLRMREKAFEVERSALISDLREEQDNIQAAALRALTGRIFPNSIHGYSYQEAVAILEKLGLPDLENLRQAVLSRGRRVYAVSGQFERPAVEDLIDSLEGALRTPDALSKDERRDLPPFQSGKEHLFAKREQTVVLQAHPIQSFSSLRDRLICQLLLTIWCDMSGKLFEEVREKRGLAYSVAARLVRVGRDRAALALYAGCEDGKKGEVLDAFNRELERVAGGSISDREFSAALQSVQAALRKRSEKIQGWATAHAIALINNLPIDAGEAVQRELNNLSPADLSSFVQDWLQPSSAFRLTMGPGKRKFE